MRVSFEWVDEDEAYPDNHCKISIACQDHLTTKKEIIGRLMASAITMMKMDGNPRGNTIFFRTVTEKEAKSLSDLLDDMRADEWKDEI